MNRQPSKQKHIGFFCAAGEKIPLLMQILVQDNPESSIVFCNSSAGVAFVQEQFQRAGIARHSQRVVVHSDVTFRGEKQRFDCVINFDVPYAPKMYEERLRAADAGGNCISLLCDYYSDFAQPILDLYPVTCGWSPHVLRIPSRKEVQEWSRASQPQRKQPPQQRRPNSASAARSEQHKRRPAGKHDYDKQPAIKPKGKSLWSRIVAFFANDKQSNR